MKTILKTIGVLFLLLQGMDSFAQCCRADAGPNKSTCCGCVTIGGNPAGKDTCSGCDSILYRWTPTTGLNNPNIANPCANPGSGHTIIYTLHVYAVNSLPPYDTCCVSTSTVSVTGGSISCCRTSGVANAQAPDESIRVYPNPAPQAFTIEIGQELGNGSAEVFDVNGKLIWKKQDLVGTTKLNVDLSSAPKGVYFVRVRDKNVEVFSKKILLE